MNRLPLILIVCVAVAAALLFTHDDGAIVDRERAGEAFLPELASGVNDAASVVIAKGDERIELAREGDDWKVASSSGYPAKFDPVRSLLISLVRLEDAEPRTSQKERLGELMLGDDGDKAGTKVTVKDKKGALLADVVLGKSRWQPKPAVYMRRAGEDQAYLIEGTVRAQTQPTAWMDTSIVKLAATDVDSVRIEGDLEVSLGRDETNAIVLEEGLPEGRAVKSPSPFNALFGLLGNLSFAEVAPAEKAPGDPIRTLTFETADRGAVVVNLYQAEGSEDLWARLSARASDPDALAASAEDAEPTSNTVAGPPASAAPADAADPATPPPAPKITPTQADDWNAKWTPWAFKLPSYRATTLLAGWDDWLEPLPEPEAESDTAAPPALLATPPADPSSGE